MKIIYFENYKFLLKEKNTFKGFENNIKHRYKRNCLLLEAATGVVLHQNLFLKTPQYSQEST